MIKNILNKEWQKNFIEEAKKLKKEYIKVIFGRNNTFLVYRIFFCILFVFCICSCSIKQIAIPYPAISIKQVISNFKDIKSIEAVLDIDYEKGDTFLQSFASLNLSKDKMDLKLYYMGFLAGWISEQNGNIISNPPIDKVDKDELRGLFAGLKKGFLWWDIEDYEIKEIDNFYEIKNAKQILIIDKNTLLPLKQEILIEQEVLYVEYSEPKAIEVKDILINNTVNLYQSNIKARYKDYILILTINSYNLNK